MSTMISAGELRAMMPGLAYRERTVELVGEGWMQTRSGLYVPATAAPPRRPTCVDLFAGCGGFSLGMEQAGFEVVAAVEWDPYAAMTYLWNLGRPDTVIHVQPERQEAWEQALRRNERIAKKEGRSDDVFRPGGNARGRGSCRHFWLWDAAALTGAEILDALSMERGELDCVVGGPPCQGFSRANAKRGPRDPRNMLVFEFARLVLELWPRTMVMENVPEILNMLTPEGVPVIDALCRILEEGGFGTYNALRRALLGTSGAGAAVRGQPRETRQERRRRERAAAKAAAQPDLFAGATA